MKKRKNIMFGFVGILLLSLISVAVWYYREKPYWKLWTGDSLLCKEVVSIAWIRPEVSAKKSYKKFTEPAEIKEILKQVALPKWGEYSLRGKERNELRFYFLNGETYYMNFTLEKGVFVGPNGTNRELFEILNEKEKSSFWEHLEPEEVEKEAKLLKMLKKGREEFLQEKHAPKIPEVNATWTGEEEIRQRVPVCIVWYKQLSWDEPVWRPYKCFSQADPNEMRMVISCLTVPEHKEPKPVQRTKDKLSLIFYNGFPEKLTLQEVYFEIKDQIFTGPVGKSEKLAKILLNRKEISAYFYYPYTDLGGMHYFPEQEQVWEVMELQRKQMEKLNTEREVENAAMKGISR
jgi:hypothetical protein